MAEGETISVEVVYGLPARQELVTVEVAAGTSCGEVISLSGIAERFADLDLAAISIAIWGIPVSQGHTVKDGDRVELLRALAIDPRDARRQRALVGEFMSRADSGQGEKP